MILRSVSHHGNWSVMDWSWPSVISAPLFFLRPSLPLYSSFTSPFVLPVHEYSITLNASSHAWCVFFYKELNRGPTHTHTHSWFGDPEPSTATLFNGTNSRSLVTARRAAGGLAWSPSAATGSAEYLRVYSPRRGSGLAFGRSTLASPALWLGAHTWGSESVELTTHSL